MAVSDDRIAEMMKADAGGTAPAPQPDRHLREPDLARPGRGRGDRLRGRGNARLVRPRLLRDADVHRVLLVVVRAVKKGAL